MHTPVLLQQVIENLKVIKEGKYIDATFGEGGYSKAILDRGGEVLAIDLDKLQIERSNVKTFERLNNFKFVCGNFASIEEIAKDNNFFPVDGVIFDLGLSMGQISNSGRGFSIKNLNEPLDMRINSEQQVTAADLIKSSSIDQLYQIFAHNSEEINSRVIAESVFYLNKKDRLNTVGDLISAIDKVVPEKSSRVYRRIFQALRIEVNQEIDNLKKGLAGAYKLLNKDGLIMVVSFHSLEDRIVKNFINSNNLKVLIKKPIMNKTGPSFEKGAKLRVIIKQ